jgi:hypothetical protein
MRTFVLVVCAGILAVSATGCASGAKYADLKGSIPALNAEKGRIYFYRISALGAAIQPEVRLNTELVGKAVPGGFWYVDRVPGEYSVVTSTEVSRKLSFTLAAGQTRYVRLNISFGFFMGHVYGELVEEAVALKDLESCKGAFELSGTAPPVAAPSPASKN